MKAMVKLMGTSLAMVAFVGLIHADTFNHLNWVAVSDNKVSAQIMFDFAQPIHFTKEVVRGKSQLLLSFPGMQHDQCNLEQVKTELEKLKLTGMLQENIEVIERNNGAVPAMMFIFTFSPSRLSTKMVKGKEVKVNVKNQLTIKWSKIDNQKPGVSSYRLVLDIFTKEVLDSLEQQNSILLQASNDRAGKKKILA